MKNTATKTTVIILLGPPGAGKGSQAALIKDKLQIPHISTGDLLRTNIQLGTELGKKAKSYMDEGKLVPSELIFDMVFDRIEKPDCQKGYILDGFPRTVEQAISFQNRLGDKSYCKAINLCLSDSAIIERLTNRRICEKCQVPYNLELSPPKVEGKCDKCEGNLFLRSDDTRDIVENRLKVYHNQTAPLIDYYQEQDILYSIKSDSSKEAILLKILQLFS